MSKQNLEGFFLLQEMVSPPEQKYTILEESSKANKVGGVKFKAILQEAEVENVNRRVYKRNALTEGLDLVQSRMQKGIFFSEMDHPITNDPKRFTSVLLKESSHRVLNTQWEGNLLVATCQTTSNRIGKDMESFIVEDGISLPFSLRATGKTRPSSSNRNLTEVVGGMRVIAYDSVSNPSHHNASVQHLLESSDLVNMMKSESEQIHMLSESMGMDLELFQEDSENKIEYDHLRNMVILSAKDINIRGFLEETIRNEFRSSFVSLLG